MKVKSESEVAQSCPTLSDPMDCSPPGSSVRGILQARVLEWAVIAFSTWLGEKTIIISASFHGVVCSWWPKTFQEDALFHEEGRLAAS